MSPFLHRYINRAAISAFSSAKHLRLIRHTMVYVSHLRETQILSRQHYIARTEAFFVAFSLLTT